MESGPLFDLMSDKFRCDKVERLVPARFLEFSVLLDQRLGEPLVALHEIEAETALHAEVPFVGPVLVADGLDELSFLVGIEIDLAPDPAVYADARFFFQLPRLAPAQDRLEREGARGAELDAGAALTQDGFADGVAYMSDVRAVDDPLPVKFHTLFIWISPQALTQRPQRMQRFSLRRRPLLETVSTVRSRCANAPVGSGTS